MKWMIIFPNNWPSYSPSCINLVKMLEKHGDQCLIVYPENNDYNNDDNINMRLKYYPFFLNAIILKITKRLGISKFYKILGLLLRSIVVYTTKKCDNIIGIDALGFIIAYVINRKAIYYSLEISKNRLDHFIFSRLDLNLLIIQSPERKNFLSKKDINVAYIQNSCIMNSDEIKAKSYYGRLIYFGSVLQIPGVEICIRSLYSLDKEILTIKGIQTKNIQYKYVTYLKWQYKDLMDAGRLLFDFSYIENADIVNYLQGYDIGFCFYDFLLIDENDFNYISSPSGKMFNYLAAGIPIIGSDTIGLLPVRDFNAGILLKYPNNTKIKTAINTISQNYSYFQNNAIRTAMKYDYAKMFESCKYLIYQQSYLYPPNPPPYLKKLSRPVQQRILKVA
jgi:glycosyltransferase involved in cell wall biosynthesis